MKRSSGSRWGDRAVLQVVMTNDKNVRYKVHPRKNKCGHSQTVTKHLVSQAMYPNNLPSQPSEIFEGEWDLAGAVALLSRISLGAMIQNISKETLQRQRKKTRTPSAGVFPGRSFSHLTGGTSP